MVRRVGRGALACDAALLERRRDRCGEQLGAVVAAQDADSVARVHGLPCSEVLLKQGEDGARLAIRHAAGPPPAAVIVDDLQQVHAAVNGALEWVGDVEVQAEQRARRASVWVDTAVR